MEFIQFLRPIEIQIIRIVENAGYKIEENSYLCKASKNYIGFFIKKTKTIVICTNNAKRRENYNPQSSTLSYTFERTAIHIRKALRHEAVHVSQDCNNGKLLNLKKSYSMHPNKDKALKGSLKFSNQ